MKNLFNTLVLLFSLIEVGYAQITLTSANAPVARTAHKVRSVDTTAAKLLNVGAAGANQSWNFSTLALDPNEPVELTTYAATTGAPQVAQFPTATLISRTGLDNSQGVTYHKINASEWLTLGEVDSAGDVYHDTLTVFKYPFTYNTTFKDSVSFVDPDAGPVTFSLTVTGDAWGSIRTQLGTFNTLRRKNVLYASFSFLGIPVELTETQYEWWTSQYSAPVLTHTKSVFSALGQSESEYFATVLSAQTVSNQEVKEQNYIAKAYPTPASNKVSFDIDLPNAGNVSAIILSINGQGMKTHQFGELSAGKQTMSLDVSNMASGVYHVILMSEKGKIGTQKITVSH